MKSLYNHKATAVWNEFVMVNKYEHHWGSDHGWSGKFYRSQELAARSADAFVPFAPQEARGQSVSCCPVLALSRLMTDFLRRWHGIVHTVDSQT
jgi:hypothetical protein